MLDSKSRKRLGFISMEGLNHFLKPAFTSVLSLVAIRFSGAEVWGSFVPFLIGIELTLTYLNWGQKPYLLRSFSLRADRFSESWFTAFWARALLLIPLPLVLYFFTFTEKEIIYCLIWLVLRFFTQSLEPVIQFQRKYLHSILAEVLSLILALGLLFYYQKLDVEVLFLAVIAGLIVKSLILVFLVPFGANWQPSWAKIKTYLHLAFPFLLLSIVGLVQAKIDLYLVTLQMPLSDVAFYQVLSGFLVMMQTGAFLILAPFQKNIYRMNSASLKALKRKYFAMGIALTLLGSGVIVAVLHLLYRFEFSGWIILFLSLYILPLFAYIIESQMLMKAHKEKQLLLSTACSAIVGFTVCYFAIPQWGLYGALLGGIFARIVIASLVVFFAKNLPHYAQG